MVVLAHSIAAAKQKHSGLHLCVLEVCESREGILHFADPLGDNGLRQRGRTNWGTQQSKTIR